MCVLMETLFDRRSRETEKGNNHLGRSLNVETPPSGAKHKLVTPGTLGELQ